MKFLYWGHEEDDGLRKDPKLSAIRSRSEYDRIDAVSREGRALETGPRSDQIVWAGRRMFAAKQTSRHRVIFKVWKQLL